MLLAGVGAGSLAARELLSTHVPALVAQHRVAMVGTPNPASWRQLDIALPMRNQAGLDALLRAIYRPGDPSYHRYLSVAEFTELFGPTGTDYATAANFLRTAGFKVMARSANRYMIEARGTVADIERVFHLKLFLYRHPTEPRSFIAPDREPTLDLQVPVLHVTGLDDLVRPTPRIVLPGGSARKLRPDGAGSGPGGNFIGSDMRAAYFGGSKLSGAGQSVGLMELKGYNPADVILYFKNVNQPLNVPVNAISTDGTRVTCTKCEDAEQTLDIDYAVSMAPGLQQVQVYVGHSPDSVLERMASDNTSKQLSTSWGWHKTFAVEDPLWQEMAVQGQTFLTASGDYSNLKDSGPWPEEDANLTAVGGTDLVTRGAGGPYASENGWSGSAGGPSLDRHIRIEPYQLPFINTSNRGSQRLRNVPDISANADTDFYICADGGCGGGAGGTSFSSPIWAGYIALANEKAAANGQPPVGFLNPALYALASGANYKYLFHDVRGGRSGHYTAVKGYDLVTGLGSQHGTNLINALAGAP